MVQYCAGEAQWERAWLSDKSPFEPQNRQAHGVTLWKEDLLLIHGGLGVDEGLADMWIFDLNNKTWSNIIQDGQSYYRAGNTVGVGG